MEFSKGERTELARRSPSCNRETDWQNKGRSRALGDSLLRGAMLDQPVSSGLGGSQTRC
ncbi:hypothetical protein P7L53_05380 [Thermoleptolyngbya sichuanensis XZ-Cy5]|nr:hypothetical protein [Thermoleptolyngbya sichuanensis XZ-Cy5]